MSIVSLLAFFCISKVYWSPWCTSFLGFQLVALWKLFSLCWALSIINFTCSWGFVVLKFSLFLRGLVLLSFWIIKDPLKILLKRTRDLLSKEKFLLWISVFKVFHMVLYSLVSGELFRTLLVLVCHFYHFFQAAGSSGQWEELNGSWCYVGSPWGCTQSNWGCLLRNGWQVVSFLPRWKLSPLPKVLGFQCLLTACLSKLLGSFP